MDLLNNWLAFVTSHPLLSAGAFVLGVLALAVLRPLLHRTRVRAHLDASLTLISVGFVFGALSALGGGSAGGAVFLDAYAVFVAAVAIGIVRTVLVLFVDFYMRERKGAAISTIFRDVASVITYFIIILLVLRYTLDINVTSLITTSAVLTAIVGLALQDVLGGVISGLVIEMESPFGRSDWIRVGAFEGQVVETGWRTTKIRTRVNEVITLPNTYLSREPVVNYSRPDPRYGDTLHFDAAYEATPDEVKRAVMAVLTAERAVLTDPAPEVRTLRFKDFAIEYAVRYWLDQFGELDRIRDRITTSLWYALRRANVRIPFPARESYLVREQPVAKLDRGDAVATLAAVPLFAAVGSDNLTTLATHARRLIFGRGERIVREGDPGDSFYVIEHGSVAVVIGGRDSAPERTIAELHTGNFFGEMSLLAGEARSATVVAQEDVAVLEVGRTCFQKILIADPAVLEPISQIAARRLEEQREHRNSRQTMPAFDNDPAAQHLLERIKSFFRL